MTDKPAAHAAAAAAAVQHLRDAETALRGAFDHPHWTQAAGRLENVGQQIANLVSVIEAMPSQEESRAEWASRLVVMHKSRDPALTVIADEASRLLDMELDRIGA
jgi:hypothetical protein